MDELKPSRVDLTGRQRSRWRLVLLRLEAGGLLQSSLPAALQPLRTGICPACPEAWIELAEAKGQVLPWLLRQLALLPDDATLASLGGDLGLCICSRERLQASQGWRHWAGLDSAAEGLLGLLGGRQATEPQGRSRALELEAWARRLLCLWWVGRTLAGPASVARSLVLDLDPAPLLPLAQQPAPLSRWSDGGMAWQLGALPRHALDDPERHDAWFPAAPAAPQQGWMADVPAAQVRAQASGPPEVREPAQRWYAGRAPSQAQAWQLPQRPPLLARGLRAPRLGTGQVAPPRAGPVLLLGADPGQPPQLCLALLRRSGPDVASASKPASKPMWQHDAQPRAMGGGGLCLDPELRLVGCFCPMNEEPGRVHPLLSS